ncbi:cyclodeaminase [Desulfospira joergensenii]|uniref:cyclodeaminase n=1 Tax=Desulfospira joergensenii TaxID=53329 RepID=UPI0003B5C6A9|nr:cyclodeaminase [Desulfospira joergensenii]
MGVLILTEKDLRTILDIDIPSIDAVEKAFAWLSAGQVSMPPIMHIEIPEHGGDVDIKSAYVKGLDRFAVKIGAGFFKNARLGLPSSPAMMVVISAKTGMAEAVLLDNAYLTDVRTAAAGAVAARYLAPETVTCAGVVGAGAQGRYQITALAQVRQFDRVLVYDRERSLADQYAEDMTRMLKVPVAVAGDVGELVAQSQAVITCTPSKIPYMDPDFLHPGLHITAMGGDLPEKQEIMPKVFLKADIIACDVRAQSFSVGELYNTRKAGIDLDATRVLELGEIVSGKAEGRQAEDQISICDLSGTGVQDTAIADFALTRAQGLGTRIQE